MKMIEELDKKLLVNKKQSINNNDLSQKAKKSPTIKVFGVGGAGCNVVTSLYNFFSMSEKIELYAINTDQNHLNESKADKKILIGEKTCNGYGAGDDPNIGEKAARESIEALKNAANGAKIAIVICGLGGGTGTGAVPVILELLRNFGIPTLSICFLPFSFEGEEKIKVAFKALERIKSLTNSYLIIPNDHLLKFSSEQTFLEVFEVANRYILTALNVLTKISSGQGIIKIDLRDVREIIREGKNIFIGIGEADNSVSNRGLIALQKALTLKFLEFDISKVRRCLLTISGDRHFLAKEVSDVLGFLTQKVEKLEKLKWSIIHDDNLGEMIRVMIVLTSNDSPSPKVLDSSPEEASIILSNVFGKG